MNVRFSAVRAALPRLRNRVADERGVTLVLSLALMLAMSIAIASMLDLSATASRTTAHSHGSERAFSVAEGGLNEALARVAMNPTSSSVLPSTAGTAATTSVSDGSVTGTASYYGELSNGTWTVYSTGSVPNPTGGAPTTRTVQTSLWVSATTNRGTNDEIWKYVFTDATACTTLSHNSNATVWASPLYVKGNLCLSNNIDLTGSPVQVGGTLTRSGNSSIGSSSSYIGVANIVGGCTSAPNPHVCQNNSTDRVYATTRNTSLSPVLSKPVFDATAQQTWYRSADLGPARSCNNIGGTPPPSGFDNDYSAITATPNGSLTAIDLMPDTAYDCQVIDASGTVRAKLKWTPSSHGNDPGTLEVKGAVYFDGNIVLPDNDTALYTGTGAIYATGTISFANGAEICVTSDCASTWNPNTHVLVMVAGSTLSQVSSPTGYSIDLGQGSKFQGALMANGDYRQQNNAVTWASVVARDVTISNSSDTYGIPDWTPIAGLPTTTQPVVNVEPIAGTFRG